MIDPVDRPAVLPPAPADPLEAARERCYAARREAVVALRALGWLPNHMRDAKQLPDLRGASSVQRWRDLVGSTSWALEDRAGATHVRIAVRELSMALDGLLDALIAARWP